MRYVDSHAHIMSEEFQEDFDAVISRIEEKHIDRVMIITLKPEETEKAIAFAKKDPGRYQVAAGIFMDDVLNVNEEVWNRFVSIAEQPEVIAIGEIGLDYHWEKDPGIHELQKELFIRQIDLANHLKKPILVHSRDAMQDTYDLMKAHRSRGLLHCFSGTKEMAIEFTKLGYYIALGGALTFHNSRHAKEVCRAVDAKYLLTETDCPYMAPEPVRGTRNEPSNIPYILACMAEQRGVDEETMSEQVFANYERFLGGQDEED